MTSSRTYSLDRAMPEIWTTKFNSDYAGVTLQRSAGRQNVFDWFEFSCANHNQDTVHRSMYTNVIGTEVFSMNFKIPAIRKSCLLTLEFFPLLSPLTRSRKNQFQSKATVVMVPLTWAWWSWLSREHISLYFLVSFTLRQPAVAWKDGAVPISRGYFHLFHKDALPISFAVMANA